jgi:hypothetical protein
MVSLKFHPSEEYLILAGVTKSWYKDSASAATANGGWLSKFNIKDKSFDHETSFSVMDDRIINALPAFPNVDVTFTDCEFS